MPTIPQVNLIHKPMKLIVARRYDVNQTFGKLILFDKDKIIFECFTLELKWMGNLRNISCIPEGSYKISKIIRPDGRNGLHIKDIPGRDGVLIHSGNFAAGKHLDISGCMLVGSGYKDINNDGNLDIVESTITFEKLFNFVDPDFEIIII